MTVTTQREECSAASGCRLLMAMELSRREWKLAFTTGVGQRPRRRTLRTDTWDRLDEEIAAAKKRFGLPGDAPVSSCYEPAEMDFGSAAISPVWAWRIGWWMRRASKCGDAHDARTPIAWMPRNAWHSWSARIVRRPCENDPGRWTWCPDCLTLYDDYGKPVNPIMKMRPVHRS